MPPKQRPIRVPSPGRSRRPSSAVLLALVAVAVVVTAGAIALSLALGGHTTTVAPATTVAGGLSVVNGIPQNGLVLGDPKAKVTLTEYIDTSCPICQDYVLTTFPSIVKTYVRTGKVKIEARVMAFVGPSSSRGRQLLLAAAKQDKAFQFAELVYRNQGSETTAWLTDDVARSLVGKIPGLNVNTLLADAASAAVQTEAASQDSEAQVDSISGTPTFVLTTKDGQRHLLGSGSPGVAAFVKALDHALAA